MHKAKQLKNMLSCLTLLSSFFCFGEPIEKLALKNVVSADTAEVLINGGKIQELVFTDKEIELKYAPKTELALSTQTDWNIEERGNPTFCSESLYFMKKDSQISVNESVERISKIMRSISTMQGMVYYSNTRRKMYELYSEAYTLDNIIDRNIIPDVLNGSADGMTLIGYQKDASFGGCAYNLSYKQRENEVSFKSINTDPLYYTIFKCVKENNIVMSLVLTDVDEGVLIYCLVQARYVNFPGFEKHVKKSFDARTEAIFKWFVSSYNAY